MFCGGSHSSWHMCQITKCHNLYHIVAYVPSALNPRAVRFESALLGAVGHVPWHIVAHENAQGSTWIIVQRTLSVCYGSRGARRFRMPKIKGITYQTNKPRCQSRRSMKAHGLPQRLHMPMMRPRYRSPVGGVIIPVRTSWGLNH